MKKTKEPTPEQVMRAVERHYNTIDRKVEDARERLMLKRFVSIAVAQGKSPFLSLFTRENHTSRTQEVPLVYAPSMMERIAKMRNRDITN